MINQNITWGGTARSHEDVRRLYDLGLQFAEIPIKNPEEFSKNVDVYKESGETLGLFYLGHGPREGDPNDLNNLEKTYLPKILAIMSLMNRLSVNLLTIHMWLDPRFVHEEIILYKIKLLQRIIRYATEAGITICLENLSEWAIHLERLFETLPQLNMTLDLGHAQLLTKGNRSLEFLEKYPERIKHIHLHDNRGGDTHQDDLHLPPGQGIINFDKIFRKLREMDYSQTITLELKPAEIKETIHYIQGKIYD